MLDLKRNLQVEAFSCVTTKTNSNFAVNLAKMLKDTIIYFCLFDESYFLNTLHKKKVAIEDFFSKCDEIHRELRIWSHLLKKSLIESFVFCAVTSVLFNMN